MNLLLRFLLFMFVAASCNNNSSKNRFEILTVPAGDKFTVINETGTSILPSGRFLTPAGTLIRITSDKFGIIISPDRRKSVTLHNGVFTIIDLESLNTVRVPAYFKKIKSPLSKGSFLDVAFSKDSRTIYLSGGDNGHKHEKNIIFNRVWFHPTFKNKLYTGEKRF